jgi:hypothetical protein
MSGDTLAQVDNNERLHQTLGRTDRPDLVFTIVRCDPFSRNDFQIRDGRPRPSWSLIT